MAFSSSLSSVDPRPVVRRIQVSSLSLTTAANNYTQGDQLGAAFQFTNASRVSGGAGTIASATLVDKANVLGACDLYLFSQAVAAAGDNQAASFSDSDMQYYVGTLSFPAPMNLTTNRAVSLPAVGLTYQTSGTALYGYLMTLTSNTVFANESDIMITLMTYLY